MRKLATIQKINEITPIENADQIELAHVLGWQCVVKKGLFQPGDMGVYFEIDSFLPIEPRYEFLRKSCYKETDHMGEGFLIRTQKFRGQISQGLFLPLTDFTEIVGAEEGKDVTDLLRVRKYEIPETASSGGTIIGKLPVSIKKTDEIRIQTIPEIIKEFAGRMYYISTKIDGTSCSISLDRDGFHVTGHNYEYKDDDLSSFYRFVKKNDLESKLWAIKEELKVDTITLQGEFAGPGIQKNRLKLTKPDWFVFTLDINGNRADLGALQKVAEKMDINTVPIEESGFDLPSIYPTVESLLKRASGLYPNGGQKEGIVIRPWSADYSKTLDGDLSFKVINNQYLLKNMD